MCRRAHVGSIDRMLAGEKAMNKTSYLEGMILAELHNDPCLRENHIQVVEKNGVVILSGSVRSPSEKGAAERAVARVRGVKEIIAELDIVASEDPPSADESCGKSGQI